MEEVHNIIYNGLPLEIWGNYEKPDNTTGYKGGWSTDLIIHNGEDIDFLTSKKDKEAINEQVLNER